MANQPRLPIDDTDDEELTFETLLPRLEEYIDCQALDAEVFQFYGNMQRSNILFPVQTAYIAAAYQVAIQEAYRFRRQHQREQWFKDKRYSSNVKVWVLECQLVDVKEQLPELDAAGTSPSLAVRISIEGSVKLTQRSSPARNFDGSFEPLKIHQDFDLHAKLPTSMLHLDLLHIDDDLPVDNPARETLIGHLRIPLRVLESQKQVPSPVLFCPVRPCSKRKTRHSRPHNRCGKHIRCYTMGPWWRNSSCVLCIPTKRNRCQSGTPQRAAYPAHLSRAAQTSSSASLARARSARVCLAACYDAASSGVHPCDCIHFPRTIPLCPCWRRRGTARCNLSRTVEGLMGYSCHQAGTNKGVNKITAEAQGLCGAGSSLRLRCRPGGSVGGRARDCLPPAPAAAGASPSLSLRLSLGLGLSVSVCTAIAEHVPWACFRGHFTKLTHHP